MEVEPSHRRTRLTIRNVIAATTAVWFVIEDLLAQAGSPFRVPDFLQCVFLQIADYGGVN